MLTKEKTNAEKISGNKMEKKVDELL